MRTGNYELSQALAESNFRSFHARHVITGREVLVHFLAQGGRSLLDTIAGLSAESRALLLDAGEQEGAAYLVTVPMAGFTTLETWLTQSGGAQVTPPVPPPVSARPESRGEFTQLFAGVPAPQVFAGVPAPQATPKVPSVPADAGSSFTQMFQPEKAAPVPAPKVKVTAPPAIPGWGGSTPDGSFTEFFRPETPLPGPMAAAVPTAPAGEFTEIYRMSGQPAPPVSGNAAPRNPMPPKAARWPAEPRSNDFAEFFQGRDTPAPSPAWNVPPAPAPAWNVPPASASGPPATFRPPPQPSADPVGSATEFFQGPLPLPGGSVPSPVARPTTGPSDFTSIVGGRGTSSPAPPRANPLPAPPGEWPPFSYPVPPPAPSLPTLPPPPALPLPPTVVLDGSNRKMVLVGVLSFVIMVGFMAIVYLLVRK